VVESLRNTLGDFLYYIPQPGTRSRPSAVGCDADHTVTASARGRGGVLRERPPVLEKPDLVRKEVSARLASAILRLCEHQVIMTANGKRMIPTRYTHSLLASMVGYNREAVTRAFRKLREAGAVEFSNRHLCYGGGCAGAPRRSGAVNHCCGAAT
jgi:hypothetical protein